MLAPVASSPVGASFSNAVMVALASHATAGRAPQSRPAVGPAVGPRSPAGPGRRPEPYPAEPNRSGASPTPPDTVRGKYGAGMAVPERSVEQRRAASQRAVLARRRRADVAAELKTGRLSLRDLLALVPTDDAVAAMRVSAVLASLPRMGPRRSDAAMAQLRVSPARRLRGLGSAQRGALIDLVGPVEPAPPRRRRDGGPSPADGAGR